MLTDTNTDYGWAFRLLSAVMTTLALVSLTHHAYSTWSFTEPMQLVLDTYRATLQVLLGWTEPYAKALLAWINKLVGWKLELGPHWRDVFVASALFLVGFFKAGVRDDVLFMRLWMAFGGSVIAFLISVTRPARTPHEALATLLAGFLLALGFLAMGYFTSDREFMLKGKDTTMLILTGILGAAAFFSVDAGLKLLMG